MRLFFRHVPITALCLLLAGCYETFTPIASARVTHWQGGAPQTDAQPLSAEQVAQWSAWLQSHRWGWHPITATYRPGVVISLTHSDGTTSTVNLMQKVLVAGMHQRELSKGECQELHSLLGVKNAC